MAETYDVVVIGGGAAGENAAGYARRHGLSVALVERDLVGGECSYWACMPSKALLRPGEVLAAARRVPGADRAVTGDVDPEAVLDNRDEVASGWDDRHQVAWVEGTGACLVRGTGRLAGERVVEVTTGDGTSRVLRAGRAVVLATGSRPAVPPVEGLDAVGAWDNHDVTSTRSVPGRFVVLGGGPVGVEMAQAFRRLGSAEVTVVEVADHLLAAEEPFAGRQLAAAFEAEGITVLTGVRASRALRRDGAEVLLVLDDGREIAGDELLVAAGRRPATTDLGLETVGLEPGKRVAVDACLRALGVDGGWLYAVGDVNGRAPLTHQGKYQARVAADVIAGQDVEAWADDLALPRVVFTDPQVAAVGLTEAAARERGIQVEVLQQDLSSTAAATLVGRGTTGTARLVLDGPAGVVVGATFTGPHAGEMLHAATIALVGRVGVDTLRHAVPAFPTLSEVWLRLLESRRR